MMGGGLCWLDYDNDGWLDLFVVNSLLRVATSARWDARGGLPRSALFRNDHGQFVNVTAPPAPTSRCAATAASPPTSTATATPTSSSRRAPDDKLLWNNGDGTFTEGARAAGIVSFGWHSGAAVGDVNGDGRPDLFVAGYTEANAPIPGSLGRLPDEPPRACATCSS